MSQVLLHINDIGLILSKLYDILNKNGHLLIIDFYKNQKIVSDMVHNGFDQIVLTNIMTKIGYKDIHYKIFIPEVKYLWGIMHLCLFLILRNGVRNI